MADSHVQQSIEWLNWYNQQYGAPQKDPSVVPRLTRAIADYLHWMESVNYTPTSRHQHRMQLELFLSFVKNRSKENLPASIKTIYNIGKTAIRQTHIS